MKKPYTIIGCLLLPICFGVVVAQSPGDGELSVSQQTQTKSMLYLAGLYRQALGLSEEQINAIKTKSLIVSDLKEDYSPANLVKYELEALKVILSEMQFERFLSIKNKPIAEKLAIRVWNGMISQNLIQGADSIKLFYLVRTHLLTTLVTKDFFVDDPSAQSQHLKELNLLAPPCLYMYYHNGEMKQSTKNPYRSDFIW